MAKETLLFKRAVGLSLKSDAIMFSHDYGEDTIPWDSITHVFTVVLKKQKLPFPILFVMKRKDMETLYYIDSHTITLKHFKVAWTLTDSHPHRSTNVKKSPDDDFKNLLFDIYSRCPVAYIDKPVTAYLKGGEFFLPKFSGLVNIHDYCMRIAETISGKEPEAPPVDMEEEEFRKVAEVPKPREDWDAGKEFEGRYTVQEVLRGGMGTVYIVLDTETVRFLALKTFQERYLWDERVVKQFIMEAEIWIKLERHPNIVQAELVKVIEGKPYIFLEYIQGTDLDKLMNEQTLTLRQILEYAIQFCEGMNYAFQKLGLVHRDIKPSNCLISRDGTLKITDFGLGKIFDKSPMDGELIAIPQQYKKGKTSTSSTSMVGTLPFMAPELFTSLKSASIQTDIYAFGVLLYVMLTSTNPFFHEDANEVISNHLTLTPESPSKLDPDVPEALSRVVLKCIDKDAELRYDDYRTIQAELEIIYIEKFGSSYEQHQVEDLFGEEDWINKGLSLASISCHREAIITFDQALKINPRSVRALLYKGVSLMNFGRILEALTSLDGCLKIDKYIWEPWFYKGEAHWKLGNKDEALACYDRALEYAEENAPILGRKGKLLSEAGKFKQALECYETALKQNPRSAEIWHEKGSLFIVMGKYEEALKAFQTSLEIDPRFKLSWYNQGIAMYNLGYFKEAINSQKKAIAIDPEFAEPWVCIGNCRKEMGLAEEALNAYQTGLKIQPDNIEAHFSSIQLLKEDRKWEEALELLDKALEIAPENPSLLLERAEVLLNLGHYEESLDLCQLVQEIEPGNEDVWMVIKTATRMTEEQDSLFKKIGSIAPDTPQMRYTDLNSLLILFCSPKDAMAFLEQQQTGGPWESYLKASLYFIERNYEKCLSLLNASLLNQEDLKGAALLKEFAEERIESEKPSTRKKKLIGTLFKKGDREKSAEELLILGLEKMEEKSYFDAITLFRTGLEMDSEMHAFRFFTGKAYGMEGMMDKSLTWYEDFQKHAPHSRGFWKEKLATFYMAEPREVEEMYHNWIGSNPGDHRPWISYLTYLSEKKYYEKVQLIAAGILKDFNRNWNLRTDSSRFWILKGMLNYLLRRFNEAQKSFAKAREFDPENAVALSGMGKCYEAKGMDANAKKFFGKLLEHRETSETGSYLIADICLKGKNIDEALAAVESSLAKNPDSLPLMNKKAQILFESRRHREFSDYYAQIYNLESHLIPLKVLRSLSLLETQGIDDAMIELSNILSFDQFNLIVSRNLSFLYIQSQNYQKAITTLDNILSSYHLDYEVHMGRGIALYLLKDFDRSYESFTRALELNPTDPDLWQFMGATNYHMGKFAESGKCWDRAIHYKSRFPEAWTNKSIFLFHRKDYKRAQECVDRALRMNSDNHAAWICRALCQWKLGSIDEAIRSTERAISLSPQNIVGWVLRGVLAFDGKNYEFSKQCFEKTTEIENKHPDLWYNRGLLCLYMLTKRGSEISPEESRALNSEAKKSLDRALALRPDFPEGLIARFVFEKLVEGMTPRHLFLSRAQTLDQEKFERWAQEYQETRDPLAPLKPIQLSEELFNLPLARKLTLIEPLEVIHLLRLQE